MEGKCIGVFVRVCVCAERENVCVCSGETCAHV